MIAGFEVIGKVAIAVSVSIVVARSFGITCGTLDLVGGFALASFGGMSTSCHDG